MQSCSTAAAAIAPAPLHEYRRRPMALVSDARVEDRDDSHSWLRDLRDPSTREVAAARLHGLLLRAARFEVARRRRSLAHVPAGDVDDLATQAANDAVVAILAKLDTFRGHSRFTTWAYKFVLLEAAVKVRRRAWQGHEVTIDDRAWGTLAARSQGTDDLLEEGELLAAIVRAVPVCLTPHQREVLTALALDGVPIDVLAERRNTTRGALYKTLHDARRKLRAELENAGLAIPSDAGRKR
jgi:RNA polymerase sigma-70 factor (ECF subfamily)